MNNTMVPQLAHGKTFAVAPMMEWTDRHCRVFHRVLSRHALLYTEMVNARAIAHGDRHRLLDFSAVELPLALQLGGSEPDVLAVAARAGEDWGYSEINLNVGCPSDRVQGGNFGACLMAQPELVADCVAAMQARVQMPVTVKCRIGIDDQDEDEDLQNFVRLVSSAGCRSFIVHARKAWLQGLSPKENREIPPLNYARVHRLKKSFPHLSISLNGGLVDLAADIEHLDDLDGLMYGRAAYRTPWMLAAVDAALGEKPPVGSRTEAAELMWPYIAAQMATGVPMHCVTRHMLGLFHGQVGGRRWRQILSTPVKGVEASRNQYQQAVAAVQQAAIAAE